MSPILDEEKTYKMQRRISPPYYYLKDDHLRLDKSTSKWKDYNGCVQVHFNFHLSLKKCEIIEGHKSKIVCEEWGTGISPN